MSLTSLTDIKTILQITTTASDALLTLYRDMVEKEVEDYCGINLIEYTATEPLKFVNSRIDASSYTPFETLSGKPLLFVNARHITTFSLVFETTTVSSSTYSINEENGVVTLNQLYDDSDEKLKAVYTAGYTTASAPASLKSVVYQGVRAYFTNFDAASQGGGNVKSKRIKDFSVDYGNSNTGLNNDSGEKIYLASNKVILDRYKRVNI